MMVTFVSECEKNALPKTRRVLDAFANRIGSRTWQTVITNDGLDAVKKLLRKTASKNTAVSCHWIRSRSRSELVWVIGNKDKFNAQGYVPVNFTNQIDALKIDEITVMTDKIFANTRKQLLSQHLFAVGYIAYELTSRLLKDSDEDTKLAKTAFIAGCLHDLGKLDPCFQSWVAGELKNKELPEVAEEGEHIQKPVKFSFEKHPRHNEISLLLYHLLNDVAYKKINKENKDRIRHAIYWHHAKPIRKEPFRVLDTVYKKLKSNIDSSAEMTVLIHSVKQLISEVNAFSEAYFGEEESLSVGGLLDYFDNDHLYELGNTEFPKYKRYSQNDEIKDYQDDLIHNARNNICRAVVVSADRIISSLTAEALLTHLDNQTLDSLIDDALLKESQLAKDIESSLKDFENRFPNSARNQAQSEAAEKLLDVRSVAVLKGPAGCGKTKIALEWAAKSRAKKIIWICPRIQVCQGLLHDLTSKDYLPNTKIEINTGELKAIYQSGGVSNTPESDEFSGDIVITTIDQVLNTITTHTKVNALVQYLGAHTVFDEYHEYINMPAFNLLFAELVECKKLQGNRAKALLVSATPNYFFLKALLGLDYEDVIGISSFNQSDYQITIQTFEEKQIDESNPLYQQQPENTIVISNTALTAQRSFIKNQCHENAILFHSKFTLPDKQALFEQVFQCFKQEGNQRYAVLRSGPVVQASLNITCSRMVTEFTHAENWLQRLGRLDRFGESKEVNEYIVAIPDSLAIGGKQISRCAKFLDAMHSLQSAKAWNNFIQQHIEVGETITINRLYELYDAFYQHDASLKAVEADLVKALKKSVERLDAKLFDPVVLVRKDSIKSSKVKIKKHSLRGDNRFVQMAVCQINSLEDYQFVDHYAYDSNTEANLTSSIELILGYGDSRQNLLAFMAKKHHNVSDSKKVYNDNILLNEARDPDKPIYLSYISEDLQKVGGESQRHEFAIYYAIGYKQAIGTISINQLSI
ncbi:CRISPR-associated endonuclease Cas3'' [Thiothrix fructosivorans]|uniref:CRISPR-associated endonuclease Cas3 n=1 Tax=Thiothrix fructosivorans TaxID=111770 RepID=A0A8B0SHN7_9GAMM|nr:CRISPR-associated endonuclease Cas3'' [Thiothrix fructosivorans]MBO0615183.1 CRISPR-associated endonuclease Cas3'' [Thiothrix fructosivorans]QTX09970.1 CRISPR-associated endonuclease Cas3'' [Thiothrix fructosivorans]